MKTASGALVTLLNSNNAFTMADLYEVTLAGGAVLRYTSADRAVTFGGQSYQPLVGLKRNGVRWSAKPQVDTLDVDVSIDNTSVVSGVPFAQAAANGAFDEARVKLYRAFFGLDGKLVDALVHFEGTVAGVDPSSTRVRLRVKSELEKLNLKLPFNIYQPGCTHAFLDPGCDPAGALRASVSFALTVTSVTSASVFAVTSAQANDYFTLGVARFTSGANSGLRRAVKSWTTGGTVTLAVPLPAAPTAGDAVTLVAGCDRRLATCQTKFANQARFRGFPHVPRPEDAR